NPRVWNETNWGKAAPEVRRWVESNRQALEVWRTGADRPEALFVQPEEMTITTAPSAIQSVRHLARAGLLEGSRREQAGGLGGAWGGGGVRSPAALRRSPNMEMRGVRVFRVIGGSMLRKRGLPVNR